MSLLVKAAHLFYKEYSQQHDVCSTLLVYKSIKATRPSTFPPEPQRWSEQSVSETRNISCSVEQHMRTLHCRWQAASRRSPRRGPSSALAFKMT